MLYGWYSMGQSLQDSSALDRSAALIEQGIELYDNEKYDEAQALFGRISLCDPNYAWALYELALCHWQQGEKEEAYAKCLEANRLSPHDVAVIATIGSLLDEMGKTEEGISWLENYTRLFPYNANLFFNLAVCYMNAGRPADAEKALFRAIRVRPFHTGSHLLLARANHMMGRIAQAYMAYNMGIMMSPRIRFLQEFEEAVTGTRDTIMKAQFFTEHAGRDPYREITALINAEVVFHDNYKYPGELTYFTAKQSYLLFTRIQFDPQDTSLYNQFYVRVFRSIMDKDAFNTLLYYCYKEVNNEQINKWLEKNEKELDAFVDWARELLFNMRDHGFNYQNELRHITVMHFNRDGLLTETGLLTNGESPVKQGPWRVIAGNGMIRESGTYRDNLTEGDWFIYHPNGRLAQQLLFRQDTVNGECRMFHPNGRLSGVFPRKMGKKEGREIEYTKSGFPLSDFRYRDDKLEGEGVFHHYREYFIKKTAFQHDRRHGPYSEEWMNGKAKAEAIYRDSLLEGEVTTWYTTGVIESRMKYRRDTVYGECIRYHRNGSISEIDQFDEKGSLTGVRKYYFRDGSIDQLDTVFLEGKINGERIQYFRGGGLCRKQQFRNDTLTGMMCFDAAGKLLYQSQLENNSIHVRNYYPDGVMSLEGVMKNNKMDGVWTYYYPNGKKSSEHIYKDGKADGPVKSWHANGRLKEEYILKDGDGWGEYREYFSSGRLKKKGQLFDNQNDGEWITYYPNDSVRYRSFLNRGTLTGREISYNPKGIKEHEATFDGNGNPIRLILYDLDGKMLLDLNEDKDTSQAVEYFNNGKVRRTVSLADFTFHGPQTFFYPNGNIRLQYQMDHGNLSGTMTTRDPAGQIEMQIPYVKNQTEGTLTINKYGRLWITDYYEDDKSQDQYLEYHENGRLYRLLNFVDNEKQGYVTYWSPDSVLMFRLKYQEGFVREIDYLDHTGKFVRPVVLGLEEKEVLTYYPGGKLSARLSYKDGIPHGKHSVYLPNGMLFRESTFSEGDLHGSYKVFSISGKLLESGNYYEDERHGPFTYYHLNGKKYREGNYLLGHEDGAWDYYNEKGEYTETMVYENGEVVEIRKK